MWNRRQDTGRSAADIFAEFGIPLTKAQNNRVQGWLDLKEWLKPVDGKASLQVFRSCPNLIRCMPALLFDPHNPSDVATEPHEYTHGPDALRYFVAGRPAPALVPSERDEDELDYDSQRNSFLSFGG